MSCQGRISNDISLSSRSLNRDGHTHTHRVVGGGLLLLGGGGAVRTVSSSISAVLLMGNTSHCGVQSNFIPLTTAHPASQHQPLFPWSTFYTSSNHELRFIRFTGDLSRVFNEMSLSGHLKKKKKKRAKSLEFSAGKPSTQFPGLCGASYTLFAGQHSKFTHRSDGNHGRSKNRKWQIYKPKHGLSKKTDRVSGFKKDANDEVTKKTLHSIVLPAGTAKHGFKKMDGKLIYF